MNLPNILTLSRIPLLFLIVGLLYLKRDLPGTATMAFLVFLIAGFTDWLDGYIARKLKLISNFGKIMDALSDKIMTIGMFVALLVTKLLPAWTIILVLLIVCREFFVTGLRSLAASKGIVISAEKSGKYKTTFQIISIAVLLAVPMLRLDLSAWTGWSFKVLASWFHDIGIGFFILAALLTITSGIHYCVKYKSLLFGVGPASR